MTAHTAEKRHFYVVERNGWFYVEGPNLPWQYSNPWRYRWEAQEHADELNAGVDK